MAWEGYWAKDGSYTRTNPIYNEATIDSMRREDARREERYQAYKEASDRYEEAQRARRERAQIEAAHEARLQREKVEAYREELRREKEVRRQINMVNHWLKRNAFARLVNKMNGKSRKFSEYTARIEKKDDINLKEKIVEQMVDNLGNPKMEREGRGR